MQRPMRMDWYDYFSDGKGLQLIIGAAGAAAMAATDFRSWRRVIQHMTVGIPAAMWATPMLAPAITKFLGLFTVDMKDQYNGAVFITGAFAIYLFEFIKEFFAAKKRRIMEGKDLEDSGRDENGE